MSDFLYSNRPGESVTLTTCLQRCCPWLANSITTYEGKWGSLVIGPALYDGFQPIETDRDILLFLGAPLLTFNQPNDAIDSASRKIDVLLNRIRAGKINWAEDLNGPFCALHVSKADRVVSCVTDLMMFIPVYEYVSGDDLMIGSHVDAVAHAAAQEREVDSVSIADFLRHQVITHPFTLYENVRQADASSIHTYTPDQAGGNRRQQQSYWRPTEGSYHETLADTARTLRDSLQRYIDGVTSEATNVAQFLSAGEDSRVVASCLRNRPNHDGLIFLDQMNREGHLAEQLAAIYRINMQLTLREPLHYYKILEQASQLVGSGLPYVHAHCVGLTETTHLADYDAVFGGFLADTLLKNKPRTKRKARRKEYLPALPHYLLSGFRPIAWTYEHPWLSQDHLLAAEERRKAHWRRIVAWRPRTAHQWFHLYPSTMRSTLGYFQSNRRLFRSYEPFMCHDVVRISASIPDRWKTGRRLFHRAFCDDLLPAATVVHPKGHFPHRAHWANIVMRPVSRLQRSLRKSVGVDQGNQGPWGDWSNIQKHSAWRQDLRYLAQNHPLLDTAETAYLREAISKENMTLQESLRLRQLLVCSKV